LNVFSIFLFCSRFLFGFRGAGRFLVYFLNFSYFTLLMERSLFLFFSFLKCRCSIFHHLFFGLMQISVVWGLSGHFYV
jgi:hypothetical protein